MNKWSHLSDEHQENISVCETVRQLLYHSSLIQCDDLRLRKNEVKAVMLVEILLTKLGQQCRDCLSIVTYFLR